MGVGVDEADQPERDDGADERNMGGVVVNPPKTEVLTYLPEDRLIVLAED